MTRVYYKEAVGAFLVFDVNSPQTFNAIIKWKHDLDTKVCLADGNPIPCLLLANKVIFWVVLGGGKRRKLKRQMFFCSKTFSATHQRRAQLRIQRR